MTTGDESEEELRAWVDDQRESRALKLKLREAERQKKKALDLLELADRRLDVALALTDRAEAEPITARSKKRREGCPVAIASDWHVEEVVNPNCVTSGNAYNLEEAKRRIGRFFDAFSHMIQCYRKGFGYQITEAMLGLLGDLMTGAIHEELLETNELGPAEVVLWLADELEGGIKFLVEDAKLERLTLPCNYGNHGRMTVKRRYKTGARNSFEWLLYQSLAKLFADDERIQFRIADGSKLYTQVYETTVRTTHGDDCTYRGGIGGILIPISKAVARWDQAQRKADVTCMGHFHTLTQTRRIIVNGSLIGDGEYGEAFGFSEEPAQAAFLIDKFRGVCHSTPLWVKDRNA